jgi:hypothetical protein
VHFQKFWLDEFVDGIAEELGLEKLDAHSIKGSIAHENVEIKIEFGFYFEDGSNHSNGSNETI